MNNKNLDINIPNIGFLVVPYLVLQYLIVPLYDFLFNEISLNETSYLAFSGIIFFLFGVLFTNKLIDYKKINENVKDIKYDIFFYVGILCFILGILIKIKSCFGLLGGEDCIRHLLIQTLRPNYLYLSGSLYLSIYLILKIKLGCKQPERRKLISLLVFNIFFFILLVVNSGVGRSLSIYYVLSCILFLYSIDAKFRKIKYYILVIISLLIFWFLLSYLKSFLVESQDYNKILGVEFLVVKVINRFSHAHILNLICENWPIDNFIYLQGLSDFFTLPGIGVDRNHLDGNDFGHSVKVMGFEDFVTGIAPTFMGDLYIRSGVKGVIIGMFLLGIAYCLIYKTINRLQGCAKLGVMTMIYPYLLYCTEDFIFLSLSSALIMYLFYYYLFILVNKAIER